MPRIQDTDRYPYDTTITGTEYIVGTDADSDNKTKSFRISDLAAYFTQYFFAQNQSITLAGNVMGGSGANVILTVALPSLIDDKPLADTIEEGDKLLVLQGGSLKKVDFETISSSGGYTPPAYVPTTLTGNGLTFVQSLNRDALGNIQGASIGTIQDSTTLQKGVIRVATPAEYNTNATNIALPPAAMASFLNSSSISGSVGFLPKFTGINAVGNSVVQETSSNIGIGIIPTERLTVNGYAKATGFKNASNSENKIFTTDGGEAIGDEDVVIGDGHIFLSPMNINLGNGSYVIPNVENKLIYITYEGSNPSGTDTITLPEGVAGQRIYIMRVNGLGGTMQILGESKTLELGAKNGYIFINNGHDWIVFGSFGIDTM